MRWDEMRCSIEKEKNAYPIFSRRPSKVIGGRLCNSFSNSFSLLLSASIFALSCSCPALSSSSCLCISTVVQLYGGDVELRNLHVCIYICMFVYMCVHNGWQMHLPSICFRAFLDSSNCACNSCIFSFTCASSVNIFLVFSSAARRFSPSYSKINTSLCVFSKVNVNFSM